MIHGLIERLLIASVRLLVGAQSKGPVCGHSPAQCIYVANHSSHLDALLLLSTLSPELRRRTRPLAAADYWKAGPVRRYLIHRVFRGVLVGRGRGCLNPLEPAATALSAGDSLIFFPEGTRGPGGTLQPLKAGIFYLARAFPAVDIIPAWIDNSHRILPKGYAIPVPLLCCISFGAPLRWTAGQQQDDFLARLRDSMEALRPL